MFWAMVREKDFSQKEGYKVLPTTIRSYETMIRLSTAHAKLRLSSTVDIVDCVQAFRLITFCIYNDEHALEKELKECLRVIVEEFPQVEDDKIKSKDQSLERNRKHGSLKS